MKKPLKLFILAAALLSIPLLVANSGSVPWLINYQGRLLDSVGQPVDGTTVDMTFTFYGSQSSDTALITVVETNLDVDRGILDLAMGAGTVIPGDATSLADLFARRSEVWLGVAIDAEPEMSPRQRVASVPFTMAVEASFVADFLGGFNATPDWDSDGHLKTSYSGDDCNDWTASAYPGASEICDDLVDNDCDGQVDTDDSDC